MFMNICDDGIISFHIDGTIFMYYNTHKQTIILPGVKYPYNARYLNVYNNYWFYDFKTNITTKNIVAMAYDEMIDNVIYLLNYHNISIPKGVRYCLT